MQWALDICIVHSIGGFRICRDRTRGDIVPSVAEDTGFQEQTSPVLRYSIDFRYRWYCK